MGHGPAVPVPLLGSDGSYDAPVAVPVGPADGVHALLVRRRRAMIHRRTIPLELLVAAAEPGLGFRSDPRARRPGPTDSSLGRITRSKALALRLGNAELPAFPNSLGGTR